MSTNKGDYFPDRQSDKQDWQNNFITQVPAIAALLKLDASAAISAATAWIGKYTTWTTKRDEASGAADALTEQEKLTVPAIRAFVRLLKTTPGVTPEMLATLRCAGPDADESARAAAQKPELTIGMEGGQVVIKFKKHGRQGVLIYSRRGAETEWALLGLDTYSPYVDNRPNLTAGQPETREYRAYFVERDQPVGEVSDVVSISVPA